MMTIQNFEQHIEKALLQRGKSYYNEGSVVNVEETSDNIWTAEVEGSEIYMVEVKLKNDGTITTSSCDCPYDGNICKHCVATFYALQKIVKKEAKKTPSKNVFESLLRSVAVDEFQDFLRTYASKDRAFKTAFELYFADKDSRINLAEKYTTLIKKTIKKHIKYGYIEYRAAAALRKEISKLVDTANGYLAKNNFKDAFTLAQILLIEMMDAIDHCDDSNGSIAELIDHTVELLHKISTAKNVAFDIKEAMFNFLQTELRKNNYFEYGDFGYDLSLTFQSLALQLGKTTEFIQFIDDRIPTFSSGFMDNRRKEFYQKSKIAFLKQIGREEEAEKLLLQNLDIVELREAEVEKAIAKKEFSAAKKLIAEGIAIANKLNHPGTVGQWEIVLLRIAVLENDIAKVRKIAKKFALERGFSKTYYRQWKASFQPEEWLETIENYIAETIQKITTEWQKNKHKLWSPKPYPPVLDSLAPIYIEEKYLDRLLKLVQEVNGLGTTLHYHEHLYKTYPAELLAIYLPALKAYGLDANNRDQYADLVSKMNHIIKTIPEAKASVLAVAQDLKNRFSTTPRRPAMIDELNKILQ